MHNYVRKAVVIFYILSYLVLQAQAEPGDKNALPVGESVVEVLTLQRALEKAEQHGSAFQSLEFSYRSAELSYESAWHTMFLPTITLETESSSAYTLGQLPGTARDPTTHTHGYPSSTISLNLASYTLFNFWKDSISYEQSRLSWERAREQRAESRRSARFAVIRQFFRTRTSQEKADAAHRSVDFAQAILENVRSKIKTKRSTPQDLQSSEVDVLNAKNSASSQDAALKNDFWTLNQLLGDLIGTSYQLEGDIEFTALKLTPNDAFKTYMERSPGIKDSRLSLKQAELSVDLAEKNRLPLPTISVTGLTVGYTSGYYQGSNSLTTGASSGANNIDIGTSVSLSLTLFGPDGFLNDRTLQSARISRDQSELSYQDAVNSNKVQVFNQVSQILEQEKIIENLQQSFENSAALLDTMSSNLGSERVSRLELRDVIVQARSAEFDFNGALFSHLDMKLQLAELLGLDSLPGDKY